MLVDRNFLAQLYICSRQKQTTKARFENFSELALSNARPHQENRSQARSLPKTKQLINTLLSYASRATRASQPPAKIAMNVYLPNGRKAVRIKMRSLAA